MHYNSASVTIQVTKQQGKKLHSTRVKYIDVCVDLVGLQYKTKKYTTLVYNCWVLALKPRTHTHQHMLTHCLPQAIQAYIFRVVSTHRMGGWSLWRLSFIRNSRNANQRTSAVHIIPSPDNSGARLFFVQLSTHRGEVCTIFRAKSCVSSLLWCTSENANTVYELQFMCVMATYSAYNCLIWTVRKIDCKCNQLYIVPIFPFDQGLTLLKVSNISNELW